MSTTGLDLTAHIAAIRARHEERKQNPASVPEQQVVPPAVVKDDGPLESIMTPVDDGQLSTAENTQWCVPPRSVRERGRLR